MCLQAIFGEGCYCVSIIRTKNNEVLQKHQNVSIKETSSALSVFDNSVASWTQVDVEKYVVSITYLATIRHCEMT